MANASRKRPLEVLPTSKPSRSSVCQTCQMFLVFFEPATVGVVGELLLIQEDGMSEEIQRMIANQIEAAAKSFKQFYSKCSRTQVQWSRSKYTPSTTCLFLQTNMLLRPILQASLSGRNKYIILAHPSMDHIKQLNCYFLRAHLVPTFSHCMLMYVGAGQIQSSSFLNQ